MDMHSGRYLSKSIIRCGMRKYLTPALEYIKEVSHLNELRKSQDRVIAIKNHLKNMGDTKRSIMQNIDEVKQQQFKVCSDMKHFGCQRSSEKYLQLVREELKLHQEENGLRKKYKDADAQEISLFTDFSISITNSHEKEKMHKNFLYTINIFASIIATLCGFILNVLYHQNEKRRLRLMQQIVGDKKRAESWTGYLNNQTRWMYSWMFPKH